MKNSVKTKLVNILTVVVFVAVLVVSVGLIIKFTDIGSKVKDELNPEFRIEYNGQTYKSGKYNIGLPLEEGQAKFTVKGTNGYKVTVTPNVTAEDDLYYYVDGVQYSFSKENLNGYIVKEDNIFSNSFVIDYSDTLLLENVLSKIWGGSEIILEQNLILPYLITITSDKGDKIEFAVGVGCEPKEIILNYGSFVF